MANEKNWLVIYTKPRWEKKVNKLLLDKGIVTYCPLNKVYRQWSDRLKKVEEPLFKSYVFVQVDEAEKTKVRMTDGVLNFVYWQGKPAVVRPAEIDAIRRFMNEYDEVETEPIRFLEPGAQVVINAGIMMGAVGTIEKMDNRWAEVIIESIGFKLRAKIEPSKLDIKKRAAQKQP